MFRKSKATLATSILLVCILLTVGCGNSPRQENDPVLNENQNIGSASEPETVTNEIQGTWKLVYADIREKDSVQVKDLTATDFIKIINATHFAFFNQDRGTAENFMAGAGTYTFDGSEYIETLDFIGVPELRGHEFPFEVEIRGDSLIQQGHEKVEEAGIDRYILEKYIRIKN